MEAALDHLRVKMQAGHSAVNNGTLTIRHPSVDKEYQNICDH